TVCGGRDSTKRVAPPARRAGAGASAMPVPCPASRPDRPPPSWKKSSRMADQIRITAEKRSEFGKGAARRIRRADKVPAVLYGHGTDPVHLTLPGHDTMMALKYSNAVLEI